MGWGMDYRLPWRTLDADRVQAAAEAVAASIPGVQLKTVTGAAGVTCYFGVPLPIARTFEMTPSDLDRKVAEVGSLGVADPPWVEVNFVDDDEWPPGSGSYCTFSFDTADSGNGLCTGAAMEITARLGRHFGVPGKASWEAYT